MRASWNHRFRRNSGTRVAPKRSTVITANTTGAASTAPTETRLLDGDVDLHAGFVVPGLVAADLIGAGLTEGVRQFA